MSKKIHSEGDTAKLKAVLGPRLKTARKALGITQEEAAERIGISSEFYARMERGHALPSVVTLAKISTKLNITVDHLFGADAVTGKAPAMPPPAAAKDPRQLGYIVDKARRDPDLRRVLMALLKLYEKHDK